jgi:hypothetical protein
MIILGLRREIILTVLPEVLAAIIHLISSLSLNVQVA